MRERALTRRSLLAGGAGIALGGLLRPHAALAALGAPGARAPQRPERGERSARRARTFALARPADLVGLEWEAPAGAQPMLRYREQRRRLEPVAARGRSRPRPRPRLARSVQRRRAGLDGRHERAAAALRAAADAALRLHLVDVSEGIGARRLHGGAAGALAAAAARCRSPRPASPRAPGSRRSSRGARGRGASRRRGSLPPTARCAWASSTTPRTPTATRRGEVPAMLRAIYAFHRFVNGWNDIGYNFVVDLYGRIFEARAGGHRRARRRARTPAATTSSPRASPCSARSAASPSRRPRSPRCERLLAWKLSLHGVPATGRVHRQGEPRGRRLQPLPRQRPRVAAADRRPPRRRLDRMPRRPPLRASCPPPRRRVRALARAPRAGSRSRSRPPPAPAPASGAPALEPPGASAPSRARPAAARRRRPPARSRSSTARRSPGRRCSCRRAR